MPALERSHAYHCRMAPGVFLGARFNHGLSILLRFPVLCDQLKASPDPRAGPKGQAPRQSFVLFVFISSGFRAGATMETDDQAEAERMHQENVQLFHPVSASCG